MYDIGILLIGVGVLIALAIFFFGRKVDTAELDAGKGLVIPTPLNIFKRQSTADKASPEVRAIIKLLIDCPDEWDWWFNGQPDWLEKANEPYILWHTPSCVGIWTINEVSGMSIGILDGSDLSNYAAYRASSWKPTEPEREVLWTIIVGSYIVPMKRRLCKAKQAQTAVARNLVGERLQIKSEGV